MKARLNNDKREENQNGSREPVDGHRGRILTSP